MPPKHSENSDKISYYDFSREVLLGQNLEDKFLSVSIDWTDYKPFELPKLPGRQGKINFSSDRMKFPKAQNLDKNDKKAMALHSFANHELLAIEMMAAALLLYPHQTEEDLRFKRGILSALKDEQKHLSLYIGRLNELGYGFGDFPLNDFFWRQMEKLKTPAQYTAMMSLTFEAANLDFAQYYATIFREFGDHTTASILDTVLEDEITHVAFGAHWMKKWRQDKSLWEYYMSSLPWPLTPARSRGIGFDPSLHEKAMNDSDFIESLKNYDDDFKITKRSL
ncbi:MAG: ferritin-like domain-containing protein [Bacteriovoracaceae bacterium]|nr:ferritin-like domain-containing protein [Bacteriovoracaceae bacterium]